MPIPSPKPDEDKNKFMSRCMSRLDSENKSRSDGEKWTHDQMIAICMGKQRKARATAARKMKRKKKEKWNG
jgi:hypothetical protein